MANLEETKKIIAELEKMSNEKLKKMLELMQSDFNTFNSLLDVMEPAGFTFTSEKEKKEAEASFDEFLIELTVSKVKKALPEHEITENDKESLTYIGKEWALIRGTDKEKAQAKQARKERALSFYQSLSIEEQKTLVKKIAKKKEKQTLYENVTFNQLSEIDKIIMLNDRPWNAFCGKATDRNKKTVHVVGEEPKNILIYKNKKNQNVCVAVGLIFSEKYLKENRISLNDKKGLSTRAQIVFSAILSCHVSCCLSRKTYSGNVNIAYATLGMFIFGTLDGAHLTDKQMQYVIDGVKEIKESTFKFNPNPVLTGHRNNEVISFNTDKPAIKLVEYSGDLYHFDYATFESSGSLVKGITLIELPKIYTLQKQLYGDRLKIINLDWKAYNAPGRKDEEFITVRNYLLQRIELMKNKNNNMNSNSILFEKILLEVGIVDLTDAKQRNRIRKRMKSMLDYWKEIGHIKNYKELTIDGTNACKTKKLHKIEIVL